MKKKTERNWAGAGSTRSTQVCQLGWRNLNLQLPFKVIRELCALHSHKPSTGEGTAWIEVSGRHCWTDENGKKKKSRSFKLAIQPLENVYRTWDLVFGESEGAFLELLQFKDIAVVISVYFFSRFCEIFAFKGASKEAHGSLYFPFSFVILILYDIHWTLGTMTGAISPLNTCIINSLENWAEAQPSQATRGLQAQRETSETDSCLTLRLPISAIRRTGPQKSHPKIWCFA